MRMGAERVIFEYVFEAPSQVQYFHEALCEAASLHLFTLWAPLDVLQAREGERPDRTRLGARVIECFRAIESNLGDLGIVVRTDGRAPDQVAESIRAMLIARGA
jgi:hypothetical protein